MTQPLQIVLLELLPPAQAAARVAALYGLSRKEVYHLALALRAVERG